MENYINALREVEKEDSDFELSLSKNEVLDIVNEFDRLNNNWYELKKWINDNCFYDNDIITYEELMNEINSIEDNIKNKKEGKKNV